MSGGGHNEWRSIASQIETLDDELEALQEDKKALYAGVREAHGRLAAKALKEALRIKRMDETKRAAAEELDAETFRILSLIDGSGTDHAITRGARHEEVDHDPDTGEIADDLNPAEPPCDPRGVGPSNAADEAPTAGAGKPVHSIGQSAETEPEADQDRTEPVSSAPVPATPEPDLSEFLDSRGAQ